MKLHPAEIVREIRNFSFFKTFNESLLLQLSTMIQVVDFNNGDFVLTEGQTNTKLFFIKQGSADVLLAGEIVASLDRAGDVIGEMSVATERPVSTSIRAKSALQCFMLDSDHFQHVQAKDRDHFLALLYKLYTVVLSERLVKTNEKARLFEIANREVHQAQMTLDQAGQKSVLVVDSDKKQLMMAKLAVGGTGVQLDTANETADAEQLLKTKDYDAVLVDEKHIDFLNHLQSQKSTAKTVLFTSSNLTQNFALYDKTRFVDTIVSIDAEDRSSTIRTILTTLTKVLSQDVFGFEKYLSWGVDTQTKIVKSSADREGLKQEMAVYFKKLGIRATILERCNTVAEELLMNAIYDAPVDSQQKPLFNHFSRQQVVQLEPSQYSQLKYGSDGLLLAISVVDPFGSLTKDIIINYLKSCYGGQAGSLNVGKGGAGRGLHQIIENSDLTIFNVKKNAKTEVICLFKIESGKKEAPPTFHYFFTS